jgi:hypothetical protein
MSERRPALTALADGIVTGLALALLASLPCLAAGGPLGACGGRIFWFGVGVTLLAVVAGVVGAPTPPGVLAPWTRRARPAVEPGAPRPGWLDRTVHPGNTWLIAGITLTLTSFLPPYLELG